MRYPDFPLISRNICETKSARVYDIHKDFIEIRHEIKTRYPDTDFMNGGCFLFHLELKVRFPEAIAICNHEHILSIINGELWDYEGLKFFNLEKEARILEQYLRNTERFLNDNPNTRRST